MADTRSGSVDVQWHGKKYFDGSGAIWVYPAALRSPYLYATISYSITRDSASSSTLHCALSGYIWRLYQSGLGYNQKDPQTGNYGTNARSDWTALYGYEINISAALGDSGYKQIAYKGNSPGRWTDPIYGGTSYFDISWPSGDNLPVYFAVHGGCNDYEGCAAGDASYYITSIPVPSYNPYTPPSPPSSVTVNTTRTKPDGSAKITWSGESGGTYGIDHFQVEVSVWRGGSKIHDYTRVSDYLYYSSTGYNPANYTVDIDNLREYNNSTRSWR